MICLLVGLGCLLACIQAQAASYFVDAAGGRDWNSGTSPWSPWKTIARVNAGNFAPGDTIYFRRGQTWEEQLTVPTSGAPGAFITYAAYGYGANPRIACCNLFSNWTLAIVQPHLKIWRGSMAGVRNSWGAMKKGLRLPKYYEYPVDGSEWSAPEQNLRAMQNGFFYAKLNGGVFYFRNDGGNPGPMEIGARPYGIYIDKRRFILIDGIDVMGPGGSAVKGSEIGSAQIFINASDHIIVRNCTLSFHNRIGAVITGNSTRCLIQNVKAYGHQSTGVYFWEAGSGNQVLDCEVYDCGNLSTDHGDMGGIGVWRTPETLVDHCIVRDNGHPGMTKADALISVVQSPKVTVSRCLIEHAAGCALQFAENSDGGMAFYNIIDGWGVYSPASNNNGIRIGGGSSESTAMDCKVYNNLIMNGGTTAGYWAALRIINRYNDGLEVKNNIFYNNVGLFEIYAQSADGFLNWDFANNLYFKTGEKAINWGGRVYRATSIIGNKPGYYSYDHRQQVHGAMVADPKLTRAANALQSDSPCIDAGVPVGLTADFYGTPVPQGQEVDIGPFEFK